MLVFGDETLWQEVNLLSNVQYLHTQRAKSPYLYFTSFDLSYMLPFPYFMTLSLHIWYGSLVSQRFTVRVGGMSWEVNSYHRYLQNCVPLDALVDKLPEKLSLLTVKVQTQTSRDQLFKVCCNHSWLTRHVMKIVPTAEEAQDFGTVVFFWI